VIPDPARTAKLEAEPRSIVRAALLCGRNPASTTRVDFQPARSLGEFKTTDFHVIRQEIDQTVYKTAAIEEEFLYRVDKGVRKRRPG